VGSRQTRLPQRLLGRDLFWWLTKLGVLEKTVESRIGRRARDRDTLIGSNPRQIRRYGAELRPRAVNAESERRHPTSSHQTASKQAERARRFEGH